jgi:hypothetical protein
MARHFFPSSSEEELQQALFKNQRPAMGYGGKVSTRDYAAVWDPIRPFPNPENLEDSATGKGYGVRLRTGLLDESDSECHRANKEEDVQGKPKWP